jgi:O-antigen/teichoic acid export membrane protein
MSACAAVAAVLAPWVITTIAGDVYAPSAPLFQLQLLALPGLTIASVMAPQWIVRGWFVGTSLVTAGAGVANLAVSLVLVPRLGARGAAWAIITTYAILAAVNLGVAYRCERAWARRSPLPGDTVPAGPGGSAW